MLTKKVWAKIDRDSINNEWLSLFQHSEDTYHASSYVWDHFLDKYTKRFLAKEMNVDEESARTLFMFLAAIHDNGKATPAFQSQGYFNNQIMKMINSNFGEIGKGMKSSILRHEISSQKELSDFLVEKTNINTKESLTISTCIGGHHGVFNDFTLDQLRNGALEYYYDNENKQWAQARKELIEHFYLTSGFNEVVHEYENGIPKSAQSILTGLVIMSDWIASNNQYFPLTITGQNTLSGNTRYERALEQIALPSPWKYKKDEHVNNEDDLFVNRFNLPQGASMRPVQKLMVDIANKTNEPSLIILEAPMGVGKTEASLLAAEIIAKKHNHGGIMFAMPTMATTNGIFPRVKNWLENSTSGNENILLKHSKVHLNDDFNDIKWNDHNEICEHDDDNREKLGSVSVHDWFQGKRSVLSPFLVTTIDNFLFAALIQKHYVLKHLGLIGKVIIIDEVHAADPYMQTFLSRAIEWAGYFGITVILLSATLPTSQKRMLLDSYKRKNTGVSIINNEDTSKMTNRERRNLARMKAMKPKVEESNVNIEYPLITTMSIDGVEKSHHLSNDEKQQDTVNNVKLIDEQDPMFINDLLKNKDGNTAIIVNTVKESQNIYEQLKNDPDFRDFEITLFHSRFIAQDRANKEKELLEKFGPNSKKRPKRSITVATQVIEQSLDLDFDFMISEIAPIDSILQRTGRLHRHNRDTRPHDYSTPTIAIFGYTEHNDGKVSFNDGSKIIYKEFVLLRTYKVLKGISGGIINIPSDIPVLVNKAYMGKDDDEQENKAREKYQNSIAKQKGNAKPYLLESPYSMKDSLLGTNYHNASVKDDIKGRAAVRDSQDSIEVIVLKRKDNGDITFVGDDSVSISTSITPHYSKIKEILGQTIVLPNVLTYPSSINSTIEYLENTGYIPAWQQHKLLQGELILILDENLQYEFEKHILTYDLHIGSKTDKLDNK